MERNIACRPVPANIPGYRQHLKDITAIQTETVRRLVESDATPPMEVAAVLEDIANKFLDMSEEIRGFVLSQQEGSPTFAPGSRGGAVPN